MSKNCASSTKCSNPRFSNGYCLKHQAERTDDKWVRTLEKKKSVSTGFKTYPVRSSQIKNKPRKATGELQLFMSIYAECKGICQITKKQIPFDVNSFMHILGKGAYPSLRLERTNILMVDKRIHDLYDNQGKEKLLRQFPEASIIYELKDKLRSKYYNT